MEGSAPALPEEFLAFKDLMRIHLKQILKLDKHTTKLPKHAVALLVMVAYEALARFSAPPEMGPRVETHWLFAQRHHELYGIDKAIGQRIFDAIRNGLAHVYGTYSIPVEGFGEVRLVLSWKDGAAAHMKWAASAGVVDGHGQARHLLKGERPDFIVVDCGSLWSDLDALFSNIEAKLTSDPAAQTQFRARVAANRTDFAVRLSGSDAEPWKAFAASRRYEVEG